MTKEFQEMIEVLLKVAKERIPICYGCGWESDKDAAKNELRHIRNAVSIIKRVADVDGIEKVLYENRNKKHSSGNLPDESTNKEKAAAVSLWQIKGDPKPDMKMGESTTFSC